MAINIPASVFDTYNEAVLLFTRTGTLVYPEKREQCSNCYMDTMGTRNRSISKIGRASWRERVEDAGVEGDMKK